MMKRVRTYQRSVEEARAALEKYPLVITPSDRASLSLAIGLLEDLTETLPAIEKREKARRERIQWIYCAERIMVARYKGCTFRYLDDKGVVGILGEHSWVFLAKATSIESATRKIRAWWRKK